METLFSSAAFSEVASSSESTGTDSMVHESDGSSQPQATAVAESGTVEPVVADWSSGPGENEGPVQVPSAALSSALSTVFSTIQLVRPSASKVRAMREG